MSACYDTLRQALGALEGPSLERFDDVVRTWLVAQVTGMGDAGRAVVQWRARELFDQASCTFDIDEVVAEVEQAVHDLHFC